ncbi:MAG: PorT family protein [Bacteroidetes bacterium]|nr:PorT family protein [Bacteroidota bacterium]
MKKILFSTALLLSLTALHQVQAQKGFSLSVKGIPQFSWLQNSDDNNNSSFSKKTTFNAAFGVGGAYNFDNHFGVGVDVLYSLQGQKYDLAGKEYRQKTDYLKIPVMFLYNTDPTRPVSFIAKLGPQLGILTAAKVDDGNGNEILDNKDAYKSVSFGGVAVAGVQFKLNSALYLTTAARYDYDFTNAEEDNSAAPGRASTHNMTAGLEVGLKYLLK